jgi:hypothetical protein
MMIIVWLLILWAIWDIACGHCPSGNSRLGKLSNLLLIEEKEIEGMDILKYSVDLPLTSSADVASKTLVISSIASGGTESMISRIDLDVEAMSVEFEVPQDSNVTLTLEIADDGGNIAISDPFEFVAVDTLPPVVEGSFSGLTLVSERLADAPVVEEPVIEEPVIEEPVIEEPVIEASLLAEETKGKGSVNKNHK